MTNFSTPHQRFTFVQLLYPYLIKSWLIFSKSLSTVTLYHSTIWRFDALSCKMTPVVQLTTVSTIFITACRTYLLPWFCFPAHYVLLGIRKHFPIETLRAKLEASPLKSSIPPQ
jgi:hypothetical protein